MSEAQEQAALFAWIDNPATERAYPGIGEAFHVPNGGSRNAIEGRNLKKQGTRAGEPDVYLLIARGRFHGLAIELKTKTGRVSKAQVERLAQLGERGYFAVMCRGWDYARQTMINYLSLPV